ncbi:MAG: hypothetical protein ACTSVV_03490 [Promethearchaeota archaeon]
MILDYYSRVLDGIEFLVAVGSLVGLFGVIIGIILFMVSSSRYRPRILFFIIISCLLLIACGWATGLRYFHVRI